MTDLERAVEQIAFARGYTLNLLDGIDAADWFRVPPAGVTHIAWQFGHLTFAQYRLALVRIRGQAATDRELIPDEFLRVFSSKTIPEADPAKYPSVEAIRATAERVHARVLRELPEHDAAMLDEWLDPPHPIAKTRLASLFWCSAHELVHAGQIALLRRQLGHAPKW
jgi:hypothetical protein